MPSESFLSRWSKRKQGSQDAAAASALPKTETVQARSALVTPVTSAAGPSAEIPGVTPADAKAPGATANQAMPQASPPTEANTLPPVESLTPESDFRPFMKPDVAPALRNQAMKSLFRDPHFNVMDMMDVYVDDYSLPDPIPESMLRQMTQSRMLKLFDDLPDEDDKKADGGPGAHPASNHGADAQVAAPQSSPELSQKAPDTTNCPTLPDVIESDPQQEKSG